MFLTDSLTLTKTSLSIKKWIKNEFKCTIESNHVSPKWPKWFDFWPSEMNFWHHGFRHILMISTQSCDTQCHLRWKSLALIVTMSHFNLIVDRSQDPNLVQRTVTVKGIIHVLITETEQIPNTCSVWIGSGSV